MFVKIIFLSLIVKFKSKFKHEFQLAIIATQIDLIGYDIATVQC